MKKQELFEKRYNILCQGRRIYTNVSHEECLDIMQEMAEKFYNLEIELDQIEMEEIETWQKDHH